MSESSQPEILHELRELEPLFHHPRPGMTSSDLAPMLSADFWRVGASGIVYTRQHTLDVLDQRFNAGPPGPWSVSEEVVRRLADETYLYTYVLDFQGRSTRRATIWSRHGSGWRATYHQATVCSNE